MNDELRTIIHCALRNPEIIEAHNNLIQQLLEQSEAPQNAAEQLKCLTTAMQHAQSLIPEKPRRSARKWQTSERTLNLLNERAEKCSNG